jgi:hypothetical protein
MSGSTAVAAEARKEPAPVAMGRRGGSLSGFRVACLLGLAIAAGSARGGVVITEIMYNPAGPDGVTSPTPIGEWVEICNNGAAAVDVSGWRLDDEDDAGWSAIPSGSVLAAGEVAVLCTNPTEFNQAWGSNIRTLKVTWGSLANTASSTNEVLVLLDGSGAQVDIANYETGTGGWPASVNGASIALRDVNADNNAGANWMLSIAGQDGAWQPAAAASPYVTGDIGSPGYVPNLVPLSPVRGTALRATSVPLSVRTLAGASPTTVVFYGRSFATTPPPPFRMVVLPDTQYYSQARPAIFTAQTQWIVNHQQDMNIVSVIHEGDVVNIATEPYQWQNANTSLSLLDAVPGLPLGICPGNHDQYPKEDPNGTIYFNQWFPYTRYQDRPWYGGHYGTDYDNNYVLFSAGGMDFIAISLEYAVPPDTAVLNWVRGLLQSHSNRRAIVTTHSLLNLGDPAPWTSQGTATYNALRSEPNLFLMLCGHIPGEARRTDFSAGTIHTLLADYQDRVNGGDGWLRILEFVPADNVINVKTYSPTLDQYETDADSQFSLWYPMGGNMMARIAEVAAPAGGGAVNWTWPGLQPGRVYEWYAAAAMGSSLVGCPVQDFAIPYDSLDLNRDGEIGSADVDLFRECVTGTDVPYHLPAFPSGCRLSVGGDGTIPADTDRDGDVDQADFGSLQKCLGGVFCPE